MRAFENYRLSRNFETVVLISVCLFFSAVIKIIVMVNNLHTHENKIPRHNFSQWSYNLSIKVSHEWFVDGQVEIMCWFSPKRRPHGGFHIKTRTTRSYYFWNRNESISQIFLRIREEKICDFKFHSRNFVNRSCLIMMKTKIKSSAAL
jgi:hypothetical protein